MSILTTPVIDGSDGASVATIDIQYYGNIITGVGEGLGSIADSSIGIGAAPGSMPVLCRTAPRSNGVAHFDTDGNLCFEPTDKSVLFIGSYLFSHQQMTPAWYGSTVGAELEAAGFGMEYGWATYPYDPAYTPADWWTTQLASWRGQVTTDLELCSAPYISPCDGLYGNLDAIGDTLDTGEFQTLLHQYGAFWQSQFTANGVRSYARIVHDEADAGAFSGDPDDDTYINNAKMAPHGNLRILGAMRTDSTNVPCGWGLVAPQGYSTPRRGLLKWGQYNYNDFIDQYNDTSITRRMLNSGQTLIPYLDSQKISACQRDPGRPLFLNASLSKGGGFKAADGSMPIEDGGMAPWTTGGQMWVSLGLGACCVRFYCLEQFMATEWNASAPPGFYLQFFHRPGSPAYYAVLANCRAAHDYEKRILGTETPCKWAGPDFYPWYRMSSYGCVYVATNLTSRPRHLHQSVIPTDTTFTAGEIIDQATRTSVTPSAVLASGVTIPGGATLILSTTKLLNPGYPFIATVEYGTATEI